MTDTPRYCVDCAFFRINASPGFTFRQNLSYGRCHAELAENNSSERFIAPDLSDPPYASTKRMTGCGPEAKWFQPKIKEAAE